MDGSVRGEVVTKFEASWRQAHGGSRAPLQRPLAAVADMQHCHPNVTSSVSILHSVSKPRHRVEEGEAMTPTCVRLHHERVRL
jgi:hypothetical protein